MAVFKWGLTLGVLYAVINNRSLISGILTVAVVTETVDILEIHPTFDERWGESRVGWVSAGTQKLPPRATAGTQNIRSAGGVWNSP